MARYFVRLKLALLASGFRRGWQHAVGLVLGAVVGIPAAILLAVGVGLAAGTEVGPALIVLGFAALALAWTLAPILLFGLDETLDPARLRLLPLSGRQLVIGLTAAAAVGVAPAATAILLLGALGAVRSSAGLLVVVTAAALQLGVCLLAGRALATFLSASLRSRRGRDLAVAGAMLLGLGVALVGQVPNLIVGTLGGGPGGAQRLVALLDDIAGIVVLTPPGWAAGAVVAAGQGRLLAATGWLLAAGALVALLAWAWQAALARTLTRPDSSPAAGGRDAPLIPRWLPLGRGHLAAAAAKELRYIARVPQLRVSYAMLGMFAAAAAIAVGLVDALADPRVVLLAPGLGALQGLQAINGFGHDRGAVWLLVAASPDLRVDLAGKALAHAGATMAVVVPLSVVLAVLSGGWGYVVPAVALGLALQLAAQGVGAVASVLAPHPMPQGANVWNATAGMGCATMLLQAAALAVQGVLMAPAIAGIAVSAWRAPGLVPAAAVVAAIYGFGVAAGGIALAARRLRTRAPEVVAALTTTEG